MLRAADQGAQHPVRMSISVPPHSASMETSNVTEMLLADASNLSSPCRWFLQDNQTEPRVTAAGHLFHSIIPYAPAVPLLVCVFVFLSVFSLLANVFTVYNIERSDELSWLPRFVLCKSLILSDLLQTVTVAPAVLYSLLRHRTMTFSPWCFFQYAVGGASVFCSLTTITCMALERYLFVCFALQYTVIVTRERMRRLLALIWLYSISIGCISVALVLHARPGHHGADVRAGHDGAARGLPARAGRVPEGHRLPDAAAVLPGPRLFLLPDVPQREQQRGAVQREQHGGAPDGAVLLRDAAAAAAAAARQGRVGRALGVWRRDGAGGALRPPAVGRGGGVPRVPAGDAAGAAVHQPAGVRPEERGAQEGAGPHVPLAQAGQRRRGAAAGGDAAPERGAPHPPRDGLEPQGEASAGPYQLRPETEDLT